MNRAIVTGASGLLGAAVVQALAARVERVEGWSRSVVALPDGTPLRPFDLLTPAVAEAALRAAQPDLIVHCAALTDVDGCEGRPDAAYALNAEVPGRLAATASELGARFVHVSTDAVYDGERTGAHAETAALAPANVYARSKRAGEEAVLAAHPGALVLRTTMHGWTAVGRLSFSEVILRGLLRGDALTLFTDVRFSPLVVTDLAALILALAERDAAGIVNLGAADSVSKEEFGHLVAREFGLSPAPIAGVTLASRSLTAARPRNTALDVSQLESLLGAPPPTVAAGIRHLRETVAGAARHKGREAALLRAVLEDCA